MFEHFTDRARRVVVWAQEESRLLNHDRIGTEHLLLGLLHDDQDDVVAALRAAGVTLAGVRQRLEQSVGRGEGAPHGHIPFTPRAKQVLEQALRASHRLGQDFIGRSHLLRGILEVRDCTAAHLLHGLGVDTDALAAVADQLARSDDQVEPLTVTAMATLRTVRAGAAPFRGTAPTPRPLSAAQIATQIGGLAHQLATQCDQLAAGLQRYGRHQDDCDPDRCTCGLDELLKIAAHTLGETG